MTHQLDIDTLRRIIKANFPDDKYIWRMKKKDCLEKLKPFTITGNGYDTPLSIRAKPTESDDLKHCL